jgi:hypothetical protein
MNKSIMPITTNKAIAFITYLPPKNRLIKNRKYEKYLK